MRFSLNWLRQWVPTELDAQAVADRLTAAGLEVDSLEPVGQALDGVVAAGIVECKPHPDADRLKVCTVDDGSGDLLTIVCGAPNARTGLIAPLARVGTVLPGGLKIKAAKLRGIESTGMLCSSPELGLGEDASGLMELDDSIAPGTPLSQALGLPDHIIEVDLTPNRADCLSIRGIARELAAIESLECREPEIADVPAMIEAAPDIDLRAPEDCPRYVGRYIEEIDPTASTPAWMVERLERSGLRSRGPGVDVTNYVLLELGQPMHAFDADRIEGGIRVRRAETGDRITLLDGQTIEPDDDMLLICDHARPVALAGIMGGAESAVGEGTRRILLESAWFNPASIIGKGRRLGLATDSSHRFERGVDPQLQRTAIERATALIVEIAGGKPGPVVECVDSAHLPGLPEIKLRPARVNHLLGTALTDAEIADRLRCLGMQVEADGESFRVRPPSARRDLALEVDLIEEVARLTGYDELPSTAPGGRLRAVVESERSVALDQIRLTLQARGFQEIISWSFVSAEELDRLGLPHTAQPLANPLSQEMAVLRTSLLPGLLRTAASNLRHQQSRVRLYETGHVFHAGDQWQERHKLGLLIAGLARPENWHGKTRPVDFYDLKGEIEHLAGCIGHLQSALEFVAVNRPWLHPGQAAEISLGGALLGECGQLHPQLAAELELPGPVFLAELDLQPLRARALPEFSGTVRFPAVRRDLALLVPEDVPAARIRRVATETVGKLLEKCIIFDIYQGAGIDSGYKSIAIGLIMRDLSRTLVDERVDEVVARVLQALALDCDVKQRG